MIEMIASPHLKVRGLVELARSRLARGARQDALALAEKAQKIVDANRLDATQLLVLQAMLGEVSTAFRGLQQMSDEEERMDAMYLLALRLIESGNLQDALTAIKGVGDVFNRSDALRALSARQASDGDVPKALETARSISIAAIRAEALLGMARNQIHNGDITGATATIEEALVAVNQVDAGGGTQLILLLNCAEVQFQAGDFNGAAQTFNSFQNAAEAYPDDEYRASRLAELSLARASSGLSDIALKSARLYKSPIIRASCIVGICNGLLDVATTK